MTNMPVIIKVSTVVPFGVNDGEWDVSTIAFGPAHFETVAFGPHGRQSKEFREVSVEGALWRHRRMVDKVVRGKVKWV